ncbi:conserved Plasmodium protein, unknown function [Plasmodium knowlesi strain H]|uniref:PUB domain-containing protein n=3 Tax=Plasmodium knowlesi TaxID=5850 RepID=A0A5K1U9C1_PLAKH|nr:PUB domain-containing protein, putative [Plasmodium knowlesi strain H]OTN63967.1 Uncharacterized protein PKNOH_S140244700 [Plasmodium knowlesi]CAA9990866.1 PUB domain-containing protein, putative [Plasmodium knowlesi strain H]SBO20911.1 conserved Plasmodium protein, unknown function [Plasmodium knowlesi strain H]SBO21398.1 conserved Plasmodium protein, unknown function [Plasmodium knowlesi strain H]VVS80340.1 PUB domain-containing protein, putative [Plasmodium knowlesi strain H]|eukprot:XP_002262154.1 hypothetical protein, conserved in Plasmodium species [Plasmodium knowlesi strain H]
MKFEECVQLLREKFPHVDPKLIEDKTKLYLINKAEACLPQEEKDFQIDDNSVEELCRIFYAEGGGKKKHVDSHPDKVHREDAAHSKEGDRRQEDNSSGYNKESSESLVQLGVGVKRDQPIDVVHERPHLSNEELTTKDKNTTKNLTRLNRACNPGILEADQFSPTQKDLFGGGTSEGSSNELMKTGRDGKKGAREDSGGDTRWGGENTTNGHQAEGQNDIMNRAANKEKNGEEDYTSKGALNSQTNKVEKREDALGNETEKENIAGMRTSQAIGKDISEKVNTLETPNLADAPSATLFEVIFRKSLLENDNIKRNISSKNFYIIGEDMLVNITIILDRVISELINHYRIKKLAPSEQEQHFENYFKVVYKLLTNISYNSKEEKYKIIKFTNTQIRTSFLTNCEIFNLTKLLFEILNFNTSSSYGLAISFPSQESIARPEEMGKDIASSSCYVDIVWKFEEPFSDKESILFEFVLTCVNIIMVMINKKVPSIRMSNEKIFASDGKTEQRLSQESEISKKYFEDPKKYLEKLSNNISPINNKLLIIHEKNKQEQQALSDIRKLHNEKYAVHKNYGKGSFAGGKNSHGISNRNNTSAAGKICNVNEKKNNNSADNRYCNNKELGDKNSLQKGTKKIKHFFKNLFKKG